MTLKSLIIYSVADYQHLLKISYKCVHNFFVLLLNIRHCHVTSFKTYKKMSSISSCASRHQNLETLPFWSAAAPFLLLLKHTLRPLDTPTVHVSPAPTGLLDDFISCVRYFSVFRFPSVTWFIVAVCFFLSTCFLTCSPPHISWKPASLPAAPPCWCSRAREPAPAVDGSVWSPDLYLNSTRRNYAIRNRIFSNLKKTFVFNKILVLNVPVYIYIYIYVSFYI